MALQTRVRTESPIRWQKAAERAVAEGIRIYQLQGSGAWIATSGSDASTAYELDITNNVAHGCSCLAGLSGDPCCKHRAGFYVLIGAIDLTPEPEPPAPAVAPVVTVTRGGPTHHIVSVDGAYFGFAVQNSLGDIRLFEGPAIGGRRLPAITSLDDVEAVVLAHLAPAVAPIVQLPAPATTTRIAA
ncbi:MAG: hypothetical protein QM692_22450 [Thermomicrobiales bacterium]